MRLPVIPFVIAVVLLSIAVYLFMMPRSGPRIIDVPQLMRLADVEGIETEVAIAADGANYAVIAAGDLWILNTMSGERRQLTRTPEREMFPAWSPDGKQIAFTRGPDTFVIDPAGGSEGLYIAGTTFLSWSATSRLTFVRERALWVANPNNQNARRLVEADPSPDITIITPRFSPNSLQIAFIKTQLNLRGEVWTVDALNGAAGPVVSDRLAENPVDVGWILEGRNLAYLTNRSGGYAVWNVDFAEATILPLTPPLVTIPMGRIGMGVWRDRMVLPRHFVNSNIMLSDGSTIAATEKLELEPAVSPDGTLVAYTVAEGNKFEVWTALLDGDDPTFRIVGREPRFAPNGYEIVYTHTDLEGNDDVWKVDIRNGLSERVTDAEEIDITGDPSPDGRSIAFASARGGAMSVWVIPYSGGKRLRINDGGYGPRYSPDGSSIVFWNRNALWTANSDGEGARELYSELPVPTKAAWSSKGAAFFHDGAIRTPAEVLFAAADRPLWPAFDVLRDGRFAIAPIDILETSLWAIDLTFKEN